uniref:Uncharacterized protein n=1 Tax=Arundo donax TaxID=35708 RepID=A0A0A8XSR7_ARUDO
MKLGGWHVMSTEKLRWAKYVLLIGKTYETYVNHLTTTKVCGVQDHMYRKINIVERDGINRPSKT